MMNTLPDEWKKSPMRSNNRRGGINNKFGKKRPGSAAAAQQPEKKKKEDDGKIVITADNPVSCLYEYAKKVRLTSIKSMQILKLFPILFRKKYLTRILIAFRKIY